MILVLGATGKVGREVVGQLVAAGAPVRAGVRSPERAGLPRSVEMVRVDLSDPDSLAPHVDDVDRVYLPWPFPSRAVTADLAPRVVSVLARAKPRIVYVSTPAAAELPDSFWARVEREIEASGAPWTFLRPTGFAGNTLMWADQIRSGDSVRWPFGAAGRSLIDERDIAAVAVRALADTDGTAGGGAGPGANPVAGAGPGGGHDGARYHLTGPAVLTQAEQVATIGTALGREVRWEDAAPEDVRDALVAVLGDVAFADSALAGWADLVDHPEPVTTTVADLTGRPARTFAEWAADHVDAFR